MVLRVLTLCHIRTVLPLCIISSMTQKQYGNTKQPPSFGFKLIELIPSCTLWMVAYWRALCLNRMDEAHKSWPGYRQRREGWRGRKCAAKSDSSTYTVQIKVSAACQLDYQMAPAALERWHATFSLMSQRCLGIVGLFEEGELPGL